ncbi:DUF805 domain-containing protein [Roseateles chitosanitabidus]|uniref:DUF805 domain-containing protein n=1 Tax=Roseateles chitosanitabidus TaxID=65048 RepID=UPI00082CF993|nr:DUF805 domain-containing protein [Roseateles chitosanitabidus]
MTEQTFNQYAPPIAGVADIRPDDDRVGEVNLFSAKGRIGRLRYLAYSTGAWLVYTVVVFAVAAVLGTGDAAAVCNVAAFIGLLWFGFLTNIKRCHDMGISGWWSIASVIPLVTLIWAIKGGDQGGNSFGPMPPPNTWGVRILAVILPAFVVLGIVAAIALPAYKGYTDRARAAQAAQQQQP